MNIFRTALCNGELHCLDETNHRICDGYLAADNEVMLWGSIPRINSFCAKCARKSFPKEWYRRRDWMRLRRRHHLEQLLQLTNQELLLRLIDLNVYNEHENAVEDDDIAYNVALSYMQYRLRKLEGGSK